MSSTAASRQRVLCSLSLLSFSMIMAACSSAPPTLGDRTLEQGKKWNRGTEMVEDGQDLIKKGNRQIKDGNETVAEGKQNVADGDKLVSQGKALIAEAEASLRAQQIQLAPQ